MISRPHMAAGICLAVASVVLAGCASSSNGSQGSPSASATTSSSSDNSGQALIDKANTKVAAFSAGTATYPAPTEAFSPGSGKAAAMGCGFAAPVCAEQAKFAVEALKAMGWDAAPAFDGQFSPQIQGGFVDRAVQDKLDGIILVSVDVNTIKASVDRAIAAGLTITCTMCVSGPAYAGKVLDVTVDWNVQGQMAAWKIMADKGDKARVVSFSDDAFSPPPLRAAGLEQTLKDNCPTCTYDLVKFATGSIAKPGPPEYTALLASRPKGTITNVVAHYDGLGMAIAKSTVQAGRTEISVGGYDGSPEAIAALISGNPPYEFSVAEPYTYAEWCAVDLLARKKAGVVLWSGFDALPSTLIIKANAQTYLDGNPPPSTMPAPSGDWQGQFKKLWGKA